jgi:signal transduction histidine kinase
MSESMFSSILKLLSQFNKGIFVEINSLGKFENWIINDKSFDIFHSQLEESESIVSFLHFQNQICLFELLKKIIETDTTISEPVNLYKNDLIYHCDLTLCNHPTKPNHFILQISSNELIEFNDLFECLPIPCYIHTFEGIVLKANSNFFNLLNRESTSPFVSTIEFMNSEDYIHEMQTKETINIQQLSSYSHTLELNSSSKNQIPVIVHTLKVAQYNHFISFVFDLSTHKHQLNVLKEMNENKSKALAVIAHDLRAPIAQIQGLSEILLKNYRDITEEHRKFMLNEIKTGTKRTQDLISNVLNWGKSQMKEITLTEDQIKLFQLTNSILKLYNVPLENKRIQCSNSIEPSIEIIADSNIINTVIRNVFSNAIKFTPINGLINIYFNRNDDENILHIYNSGDGIKEDILPYLFSVNSKNISIGTSNEKGTGIGLYICKELLKKINGRIWVSTNTISGTTFSIAIPNTNKNPSIGNLNIDFEKIMKGENN